MNKPRICAVITSADASVIKQADQYADLYELRLDMIGLSWPSMLPFIHKPWIATCRLKSEGGTWDASEAKRKEEILKALSQGASMIDLELGTPNLERLAGIIKKKSKLIISYHNYHETPSREILAKIVEKEFKAGADIAKIATTANCTRDALRVLQIIQKFPGKDIVAIAMGEKGSLSRILAPLIGSPFTYASTSRGLESADGQFPAAELKEIYGMLGLS
jgi:3-dehydroquinate dehydratase-1